MSFILLLISVFGWFLAVVTFEAGFQLFKTHVMPGRKGLFCRLWWGFLALITIASGPIGLAINILPVFALAASHTELASVSDDIVTLISVLRNIPSALHHAFVRLRPFFK
jgi:hypothetical protein